MNATIQNTHYDTLGVAREATADEIRKAYLKLAHRYHPDKTGGDKVAEARLKEINAAYDTLKNVEKRKQYDLELEGRLHGFEGFGGQGFPGAGFDSSGEGFGSAFEDLFGSFFARGSAQAEARREYETGANLEIALSITLEEAFTGVRKTARIRRPERCTKCSGSGAAPGTAPQPCTPCHGSGQLLQQHGAFSVRTTCPRCHGTGQEIAHPCASCKGTGQEASERVITVEIPAGIEAGTRLRLAGQGGAARRTGTAGDLFVEIMIAPHPVFQRTGADILCEVPLSITQAALGDRVRVPTLSGVAELTIPEGTQHGAQFRMRGQGMPLPRGTGRGDQLVRVAVEVPVRLSSRQRELLRELAGESSEDHLPRRSGFLEWLRKFRSC